MKEEHFRMRTERRDAAENRRRILDAARALFGQNGVEQVSMNQIATAAQIGPGTLYRRYSNKGELCRDLIQDSIDGLFEDIEACLERKRAEAPSERLKEVLRLFVRFRENKSQLLKGMEDSASKNRSVACSPLFGRLHEIFVELFEEMRPKGLPESNSVFKADMLLTAFNSDSYIFQREMRGFSPEQIVEQVVWTFFDRAD